MRKIIINTICIIALGFNVSSCNDVMDINTNPNYPSDASMNLLLPSAELALASVLGSEMHLVGSIWSQFYTQSNSGSQYSATVIYAIQNSHHWLFWNLPYTASLPDLKIISKKAVEAGAYNYLVASEVLTCFIYYMLTSWYEDIPYSEALMGKEGITEPKFDKGKDINGLLIKRLDDALAKVPSAKASPVQMGKDDLLYGGDMDKWEQLGHTLKLMLMLMDYETNKAEIAALAQNSKLLTEDCKFDIFSDKENNSNPLYENDRRNRSSNNLSASTTLLEFLRVNNDPRIPFFIEKNKEGTFLGLNQGDRPSGYVFPLSKLCRAKIMPEDAVYLISLAQVHFLKAEVFAREGNLPGAEAEYKRGVTAAFAQYELDASDLLSGAYAFKSGSLDEMLKCILTQKWVSSVRCNAWSAFFDINRTGYPELGSKYVGDEGYVPGTLVPVLNSALRAEQFPKRMVYPANSTDNNINAPTEVAITVKQWWQK